MDTVPSNPPRALILLIDDDPGDRELTRRALEGNELRIELRMVNDGRQALDYLLHRNQFGEPASAPRPDLILLDLNMPRMNGRRVLQQLREHPELDRIPVIVLTTSGCEDDVLRSYDLGCNSFITKPVEIGKFIEVVRQLGDYWFELVALPGRTELRSVAAAY